MTTRRISEDAPEHALSPCGAERSVDVGLRHDKIERAVKRFRLRASPEDPARAIELPLIELHMLVPPPDSGHAFLSWSEHVYIV
jgi:hypothetical protein